MPSALMRRLAGSLLPVLLSGWLGLAGAQQLRVLVQSSPLAGYQFHDGGEVWNQLRVGDALRLVREPDNPHDPNAVRVEWHGHQLGYLPRAENREIAAELDRGSAVEARIAQLRPSRSPWRRILIDVLIRL